MCGFAVLTVSVFAVLQRSTLVLTAPPFLLPLILSLLLLKNSELKKVFYFCFYSFHYVICLIVCIYVWHSSHFIHHLTLDVFSLSYFEVTCVFLWFALQYLERELRMDGLPFQYDFEVCM